MSEEKKKPSNEKRHGSIIAREYKKHYERKGPRFRKYWVDETARVNVVLAGEYPSQMSVTIHNWNERDGFAATAPYFEINQIIDTKDKQLVYALTYQEDGEQRMKMATTFAPVLRAIAGINKHNILESIKRELTTFMRQEAAVRSGDPFQIQFSDDEIDAMLKDAEFDAELDKLLNAP